MSQIIIVIHVLLGLGIIGLILIQQGKGADAGASFGSGSSGSVFGSQGAGSFLSRSTATLATLFFLTSLGLAVLNGRQGKTYDLMNPEEAKTEVVIPQADNSIPNGTLPVPQSAQQPLTAPVPLQQAIEPALTNPASGEDIENEKKSAIPETKGTFDEKEITTTTVPKPEAIKPVEIVKPVEITKPKKVKTPVKPQKTSKSVKEKKKKANTEKKN